jgi:hypothetical protein
MTMRRSESIKDLTLALAKAQGQIKEASKDRTNPHFGQAYATLASVWEACRQPLSQNGLAIIQTPATSEDGMMQITTLLAHSSGEWIEDILTLMPRDKTPQSFGSAVTYGRRYALMAMVGIAPGDDDDGNAASMPDKARPPSRKQPAPEQKPKQDIAPAAKPEIQAPGVLAERMNDLSPNIDPKKWPKGSVAEYCQARYGTAKISAITGAQFSELMATVKKQSASDAMADIKRAETLGKGQTPAPDVDMPTTPGPMFDEPGSDG